MKPRKGKYKLTYTVDGYLEELLVEVELKQLNQILKPKQNSCYCIAYVNGSLYTKFDLNNYVNPSAAAEEIGLELKDKLKKKLRSENKSFRIKKEEIK